MAETDDGITLDADKEFAVAEAEVFQSVKGGTSAHESYHSKFTDLFFEETSSALCLEKVHLVALLS